MAKGSGYKFVNLVTALPLTYTSVTTYEYHFRWNSLVSRRQCQLFQFYLFNDHFLSLVHALWAFIKTHIVRKVERIHTVSEYILKQTVFLFQNQYSFFFIQVEYTGSYQLIDIHAIRLTKYVLGFIGSLIKQAGYCQYMRLKVI